MKKRLLSLLCVLVLTVSVIPAASALEGEAARAADTLSTLGLIDSTYNLDAPATRAQAAVLLVHLAGAEQAAAADNWLAGFRDVPASIAQEVNYAARQGWITGVTATAFRPDAALTANAWSAFLLRMLGYSDKAGDFTIADAAGFAQRIGLFPIAYTGTLTQGTFKVVKVCPVEGGTEDGLVEAAALAESWSKHPISLSIKAAYGKDIDSARVTDVEELGGHGVTAKVDGKLVAAGNARLMAKLGLTVPDVPQTGTIVHVAIDGKYAGYLLISDVVKPHSAQAIKGLKQAGVRKTVMLTGDAEPVAKAVSAELGIDEYHAGLLPGDKVDQIEKLLAAKKPKEMLAFVGDGINDAPVLSRVDVGIAMGALGSDAAIEAADVVLMDDDPAKIALAMRIARRTKSIVYQNIVFALAIKAACLLLGALGIANMWAAIFADVGVMVLAVLNATRALYTKNLIQK